MKRRNVKLLGIVSLAILQVSFSLEMSNAQNAGPEEPSPEPIEVNSGNNSAPLAPGPNSAEPIVPDTTYGTVLQPTPPAQMMAPNAPLQGRADMFINAAPPGNRPPFSGNVSAIGGNQPPVDQPPVNQPPVNQPAVSPLLKQEPKPGLFAGALRSLITGGVKKNVGPVERPWWIPAQAITNDAMVAPYHNMDIFWWDKKPMPNHPQWVRLSTSVSRYWNGFVSEPCFIYIQPIAQAPGNFVFTSRQPNGPRGWLQALSEPDGSGFPQYRYWLDQPF